MKPRSERDKRYEEKHKNESKAKNVVWERVYREKRRKK